MTPATPSKLPDRGLVSPKTALPSILFVSIPKLQNRSSFKLPPVKTFKNYYLILTIVFSIEIFTKSTQVLHTLKIT